MAVGLAYPSSALDDKEERMEGNIHKTNKVVAGVDVWTKTRQDFLRKNSAFLQEEVFFGRKTLHFCCVFSTLTNLGDLEEGSWVVELLTQFGRKDHYFSDEII